MYQVSIGKARLAREGEELTLVSFGHSLYLAEKAIQNLKAQNLKPSIELIDLRSLYPYDWSMIKKSLQKTGRILFVNEDTEVANFGEHLAYRCMQDCFYDLRVPPRVLAGKQVPGVGLHPNLESATVPQAKSIEEEIKQLLQSSW